EDALGNAAFHPQRLRESADPSRVAAPIVTRQGLSASAHDRLRRHVLYGVAIVGMLTGAAGAVISLEDVAIDPRVVLLFAPDIVIGLVIVWQLLARIPIDT